MVTYELVIRQKHGTCPQRAPVDMIHERGIGGWEDNESNRKVATRVNKETKSGYSAGWVGGNRKKGS
jgi:hypothetical protein